MDDVVPALFEKIKSDFDLAIEKDRIINNYKKLLEKEKATLENGSDYSRRLGEILAKVLSDNFREDTLPDGKMYWNVAKRTIEPMIKYVYDLVNDYNVAAQKIQDKKIGIGLNPIRPKFNQDRVNDLMNKIVNLFNLEEINE